MRILFFSTLPNLSAPKYQQKMVLKTTKNSFTVQYLQNFISSQNNNNNNSWFYISLTFFSVLWVLFFYYSKLSVATNSHESLIIWKFILFCSNNILRIFIIKTDLGTMNHRCQGIYLKECDEINKTKDSEEEMASLWKGRKASIR